MGLSREIDLLYVEDDEDNAKITMKMLDSDEHVKFKVDHKTTLKCSLEALEKHDCNYDVVLLDLMLPNSQGLETYEAIRNFCKDIPIVIISGFSDIACECVKRGAQDYILKPDITPGLIIRSLRYAIERKKLENERLLVENRFKDVMTHTPLGVHMYELSDDKLYFCGYNPAADKILKIDHSELLGLEITDAFPNVGEIKDLYINIIKTGEPWNEERVDYEDENVSGIFSVYAFRTGKNKMATTFEDITVKAKMEDELKKSEKKYKELVEVTQAAIYEIDFKTLKFTYVNDEMSRLTGWSKEELLEMNPLDILADHSVKDFYGRLEDLKLGNFIPEAYEFEGRIKNGDRFWALITAKYKVDEDNNVIGANVVAIDITDKKVAEEKAKNQEAVIFNELETRLQQWRKEIQEGSAKQQDDIRMVRSNIESITNGIEVTR